MHDHSQGMNGARGAGCRAGSAAATRDGLGRFAGTHVRRTGAPGPVTRLVPGGVITVERCAGHRLSGTYPSPFPSFHLTGVERMGKRHHES